MSDPGKRPSVNLYLVGFMGTGKSAVGRALAHRLGLTFIDSDAEIEKNAGTTIAEVFEKLGEAAFRRMERAFIESGHPESGCVISCGGGLVVPDGMIEALRKRGVIVCLTAQPETILARTQGNRTRPLLDSANPLATIRDLLAQREPMYRKAGTEVLTDFRPLPEVVAHVQRVFLREAREFRPTPA